MELLAKVYILRNDWPNAMEAADMVLQRDKRSAKAIEVKAEALFNVCQFEHAMVHFHRGMVSFLSVFLLLAGGCSAFLCDSNFTKNGLLRRPLFFLLFARKATKKLGESRMQFLFRWTVKLLATLSVRFTLMAKIVGLILSHAVISGFVQAASRDREQTEIFRLGVQKCKKIIYDCVPSDPDLFKAEGIDVLFTILNNLHERRDGGPHRARR